MEKTVLQACLGSLKFLEFSTSNKFRLSFVGYWGLKDLGFANPEFSLFIGKEKECYKLPCFFPSIYEWFLELLQILSYYGDLLFPPFLLDML